MPKQSKKVEVPKASPATKKAIAFFEGKKSAIDMLEMDKRKKLVHSGYVKTKTDKFFEWIEQAPVGKWVALTAATALVVAVAYWGIKQ